MHIQFHDPYYLWLLLGIPILAFLKCKKGTCSAILFSSTSIAEKIFSFQKSKSAYFLPGLRLLSLSLLVMALARPQLGKGQSFTESSGIDIVLALDISSSMLALDFSTKNTVQTRLDVAKSVLEEFISKRTNDRIGIIAFAGQPYLVSPLTLNNEWLTLNLNRLAVGLVPDGTAIGNAIASGVNRLKDLKAKSRVIILLTDGENNSGNVTPIAAAEIAKAFETKVYTIVAGRKGFVPAFYIDQVTGKIAKNRFGQPSVIRFYSQADVETLEKISQITYAKSYQANNLEELTNIYNEINALEKTKIKIKNFAKYDEIYFYFLYLALLCLITENILNNTRYRKLP